jgi:hypothetical protein
MKVAAAAAAIFTLNELTVLVLICSKVVWCNICHAINKQVVSIGKAHGPKKALLDR